MRLHLVIANIILTCFFLTDLILFYNNETRSMVSNNCPRPYLSWFGLIACSISVILFASDTFNWIDKKNFFSRREEDKFFSAKTVLIKRRLDRLVKEGLVERKGLGKHAVYSIYAIRYKQKEFTNDVNLLIKDTHNRWWIIYEN